MVLSDTSYITDGRTTREYFGKERYQSPREAIREGVGNAFAAIQRAKREGYISFNEAEITVDVRDRVLQIRDNGIGVPEAEADKLRTVADSDGKEDPHILASYGIGRFSLMMLAEDDEVNFVTNAREDDSSYGVKFSIESVDEIDRQLDNPGSLLEVDLDENVNVNELVNWCESNLRYLPIEVNVIAPDREFIVGGEGFVDMIDEDSNTIHYEDENVEFVIYNYNSTSRDWSYSDRSGVSLYQHFPAKRTVDFAGKKNIHFNIKRSDGATIEGPHGESVELPTTTNDRGRFKEDELRDFLDWCYDIFAHEGFNEFGLLERNSDNPTEMVNSGMFDFYFEIIDEYEWNDEVFKLVAENYNTNFKSYSPENGNYINHVSMVDLFGENEVYVGKTINKDKARVVGNIHDDPVILKIVDGHHNELISYGEAESLGFKKLKDVPLDPDELDELGVTEDVLSDIRKAKDEFTVYGPSKTYDRQKSIRKFRDIERIRGHCPLTIVFPERGEPNISDYYRYISKNVYMMTTKDSVRDEICDGKTIVRAESIDWDFELPEGKVMYSTTYSEDTIKKEYPDRQVINEISPSFLVANGGDRRKLILLDEVDDYEARVNGRYKNLGVRFKVLEEFGDEAEEVQDELERLGDDSALWQRLKELK